MNLIFKTLKNIAEGIFDQWDEEPAWKDLHTKASNPETTDEELQFLLPSVHTESEPYAKIKSAILKNPNAKLQTRLDILGNHSATNYEHDHLIDFLENPQLSLDILEDPSLFGNIESNRYSNRAIKLLGKHLEDRDSQKLIHNLKNNENFKDDAIDGLTSNNSLHPELADDLFDHLSKNKGYNPLLLQLLKNNKLPHKETRNSIWDGIYNINPSTYEKDKLPEIFKNSHPAVLDFIHKNKENLVKTFKGKEHELLDNPEINGEAIDHIVKNAEFKGTANKKALDHKNITMDTLQHMEKNIKLKENKIPIISRMLHHPDLTEKQMIKIIGAVFNNSKIKGNDPIKYEIANHPLLKQPDIKQYFDYFAGDINYSD